MNLAVSSWLIGDWKSFILHRVDVCGLFSRFRDWSKSMGGVGWGGPEQRGGGHEVLSFVQGVGRTIFSYP